jgi:hypothetical protein
MTTERAGCRVCRGSVGPRCRLALAWSDEVDLGCGGTLRHEGRRFRWLRGAGFDGRRKRIHRTGKADDGRRRRRARREPLTALLAKDQMARIVPAAGDANHVKGWDNGTQVTVKVPTHRSCSREPELPRAPVGSVRGSRSSLELPAGKSRSREPELPRAPVGSVRGSRGSLELPSGRARACPAPPGPPGRRRNARRPRRGTPGSNRRTSAGRSDGTRATGRGPRRR